MSINGVFPIDIWRVVLHYMLLKHGEEHSFAYNNMGYYKQNALDARIHSTFYSESLHQLSLIHPAIRKLLQTNTIEDNRRYKINRLY